MADHYAQNDEHALQLVRKAVARLNRHEPVCLDAAQHRTFVSPRRNLRHRTQRYSQPYDVREVIARIVDGSDFDEFKQLYGTTLVTGFARIHGYPVGLSPITASCFLSRLKGAHFVESSAQRKIPPDLLQNVTGFMVGQKYEAGGIARNERNGDGT